jgi:hypothetical protein
MRSACFALALCFAVVFGSDRVPLPRFRVTQQDSGDRAALFVKEPDVTSPTGKGVRLQFKAGLNDDNEPYADIKFWESVEQGDLTADTRRHFTFTMHSLFFYPTPPAGQSPAYHADDPTWGNVALGAYTYKPVTCAAFAPDPDHDNQPGYACPIETTETQPDHPERPMFKLVVYIFGDATEFGNTIIKPTSMKLYVQFYKPDTGLIALDATVRAFETAKHIQSSQDVDDHTSGNPEESIDFDALGFFSFETEFNIGPTTSQPVLSTDIAELGVTPEFDSRKAWDVKFCFTGESKDYMGNVIWDPKLGIYDTEVAAAIDLMATATAASLLPSVIAALAAFALVLLF